MMPPRLRPETFTQDAMSRLEIIFHPSGKGGGPKLHYAGEVAATAFTKTLPGLKPRAEEISDTIQMIHDAYSHATQAMHALIVLFLWDRFPSRRRFLRFGAGFAADRETIQINASVAVTFHRKQSLAC